MFTDLIIDRGKDCNEQIEEHHVADEEVETKEDWDDSRVEIKILTLLCFRIAGSLIRFEPVQTQFPVHLPVGQPEDILNQEVEVVKMKRGLRIEEGLAGGAIGEDENDKEHEKAQELRQHPVHDDHLGADVPPDME